MTTDDQGTTTIERLTGVLSGLLAVPAVLILFAAGLYAVGDAVLSGASSPKNPGVLDSLLTSGAVLVAIRLAIIAAAAYIVISIIALVGRRQWLTRVGPVEVSARVGDLESEVAVLRDALDSAERRADGLEDELAAAEEVVDGTLGNIGQGWKRK